MPRDLRDLIPDHTHGSIAELTRSPDMVEERLGPVDPVDSEGGSLLDRELAQKAQTKSKRDQIHPYTQTLTLSDVDSCERLEQACFPPQEAATRAKFEYRLKAFPELCLGIFTSHEGDDIPTAATSAPVYTGAPERKAVLLGHIIATKSHSSVVTDKDMDVPTSAASSSEEPGLGHKKFGRTICLHSLAVLPDFREHGLARTLMQAYIQRIKSQDVADRIALITHDNLIRLYEKFGFVNQGPSKAQFGGSEWFDMILDLKATDY